MSSSPELTTLTALAQALSKATGLGDSLDAALATVAEMLGLETGWVFLIDETGEPRLAAARALPPALRESPETMRGDCYCLSTFRAGDLRGAANVNVVRCSRLGDIVGASSTADTASLRCHASVPLAVGERRLGMLNVASRDWRVLSDDELNLLTTAGALVSLTIERARLEAAGALAVAAEERNRLAREIHDTLAQGLAALTMQLEVADTLADARRDEPMREVVARALALARSTLDEARHSVLGLRAAPLDGRTLAQALEELAAEARGALGGSLDVSVAYEEIDSDGGDVPAAVKVGLYRIAQQALANIARHAGVDKATVHVSLERDSVRMRIEDDGMGFHPASVPPGRFGLVGMNERARLLGGTLTVESWPGGGTAVDLEVPLGRTVLTSMVNRA